MHTKLYLLAMVIVLASLGCGGDDGLIGGDDGGGIQGVWDLNLQDTDEEFLIIDEDRPPRIVEGVMLVDTQTLTMAMRDSEGGAGIGTDTYEVVSETSIVGSDGQPLTVFLSDGDGRLTMRFGGEVNVVWERRLNAVPKLSGAVPVTYANVQGTWELNTLETTRGFLENALPVGGVTTSMIIEPGIVVVPGAPEQVPGIPYDLVGDKVLRLRVDELDYPRQVIHFSEPELFRVSLVNDGNRLIFGLPEIGDYVEVWDRY